MTAAATMEKRARKASSKAIVCSDIYISVFQVFWCSVTDKASHFSRFHGLLIGTPPNLMRCSACSNDWRLFAVNTAISAIIVGLGPIG